MPVRTIVAGQSSIPEQVQPLGTFQPTDVAGQQPIRLEVQPLQPPAYISLQITDVLPASPVEHTPISIAFALNNIQSVPLSGTVQSDTGETVTITDLAPMATFIGTVNSTASSAGPARPLSLAFYDGAAQGEFPPPSALDSTTVDVAATFVLTIDSLTVDKRCNALEDDIVAGSVLAKLGDTPLGNPADPFDKSGTRAISLDKVPPGAPRPLGIEFSTFKSLPASPPLSITYTFAANCGEDVVKAIMNVLSGGSAALLTVLYPQASSTFKAIDDAVKTLHDLIFGNCGRPVAVDSFLAPNDLLLAVTEANGIYTQLKRYNVQPPRGWPCQDSQYTIAFTIRRTSFKL